MVTAVRLAPRRIVETPLISVHGGLNLLDGASPDEHVAGKNWLLERDGGVRPRPGNKRFNATALGSGAVPQGIWEYRRQSDQINRLIAYAGGTLSKGDDASRTFTTLLSSLSATAKAWGINAQDLFWWCNGVNTPRLTDATDIFRIGIIHPAAAPTVAVVAVAGNLPAEDHFYRYTYIRKEGGIKIRESNPSAESTKVTNSAGNAQNDVTVVASADAQVTNIHIYRRSSISVPEYKFVAEVTNANQTYRDNLAAASLGELAFWEPNGGSEDHGYPPDELFSIVLHKDGRAYGWGKRSRLLYTRVLQLPYWPGASGGVLGGSAGVSLEVNPDDGDEGMALLPEGDALLAIKREHLYRLSGEGPPQDDGFIGNWLLEKRETRLGCAAKLSAALGPAGAFWLADEGPVRVERAGLPVLIGQKIMPWILRSDDITAAIGWAWGPYYFLFLPFNSFYDGMVWCVLNRSWWPIEDMDVRAMVTREGNKLVWAGKLRDDPTSGFVYEWDGQPNDNGVAVLAEMTTGIVGPKPGTQKLAVKTRIHLEANPGNVLTGRVIPDESGSYIQRELKLAGPATGARIVKDFPGTKKLQGNIFQLFLGSLNSTVRPAVHGWEMLMELLNRRATPSALFADVFTDPTVDVGVLTAGLNILENWDHQR